MSEQTCARCGDVKQLDQFPRQAKRPSGRGAYCRDCKRGYAREWYEANREAQLERVARNNERYLERNRAFVDRLKARPCTDCGQRFPSPVMEFDHVRGEKFGIISALVHRASSLAAIEAELEKCELVCANCHRLRTAERGGWSM